MNIKGSLVDSVDTRLRIYPSLQFCAFLNNLPDGDDLPVNLLQLIDRDCKGKRNQDFAKSMKAKLDDEDIKRIKKIKEYVERKVSNPDVTEPENDDCLKTDEKNETPKVSSKKKPNKTFAAKLVNTKNIKENGAKPLAWHGITTSDIDWLYSYLQNRKNQGDDVPYLHTLLEGANVAMPENKIIKRNPGLEARCAELRAQQETMGDYTTMTLKITVDSEFMRLFENKISYQKSIQSDVPQKLTDGPKRIRIPGRALKKTALKEHQD